MTVVIRMALNWFCFVAGFCLGRTAQLESLELRLYWIQGGYSGSPVFKSYAFLGSSAWTCIAPDPNVRATGPDEWP
jgi:hypothetical protein